MCIISSCELKLCISFKTFWLLPPLINDYAGGKGGMPRRSIPKGLTVICILAMYLGVLLCRYIADVQTNFSNGREQSLLFVTLSLQEGHTEMFHLCSMKTIWICFTWSKHAKWTHIGWISLCMYDVCMYIHFNWCTQVIWKRALESVSIYLTGLFQPIGVLNYPLGKQPSPLQKTCLLFLICQRSLTITACIFWMHYQQDAHLAKKCEFASFVCVKLLT